MIFFHIFLVSQVSVTLWTCNFQRETPHDYATGVMTSFFIFSEINKTQFLICKIFPNQVARGFTSVNYVSGTLNISEPVVQLRHQKRVRLVRLILETLFTNVSNFPNSESFEAYPEIRLKVCK